MNIKELKEMFTVMRHSTGEIKIELESIKSKNIAPIKVYNELNDFLEDSSIDNFEIEADEGINLFIGEYSILASIWCVGQAVYDYLKENDFLRDAWNE